MLLAMRHGSNISLEIVSPLPSLLANPSIGGWDVNVCSVLLARVQSFGAKVVIFCNLEPGQIYVVPRQVGA
jgi:hypothetical protein